MRKLEFLPLQPQQQGQVPSSSKSLKACANDPTKATSIRPLQLGASLQIEGLFLFTVVGSFWKSYKLQATWHQVVKTAQTKVLHSPRAYSDAKDE